MDSKPFSSISGTAHETTEPVDTTATPKGHPSPPAASVRDSTTSSSSSLPTTKKLQAQRSTSATNSPLASRESSPVRPTPKSTTARSSGPGRSRKNSAHDVSPSRSATNPLSAAAQQRALSVSTTPKLQPTASDPTSLHTPVPQKLPVTSELKETPRWPVSPRLRSPPPVNKLSSIITSPRKSEQETPGISFQRAHKTQSTEQHDAKQTGTDSELEESLTVPGMRTPARGVSGGASSTLETVQEISQPGTPANGLDRSLELVGAGKMVEQDPMDYTFVKSSKSKNSNESGSESGGKGDVKVKPGPASSTRHAASAAKHNTTSSAGRGKTPGEGSASTMTIETETVTSIPQVALGGVAGNGNSTLRAKPSSETIRPKKEKKKSSRKAPSVTSGTGEPSFSSKPIPHHHHKSTRENSSETAFPTQRSPNRQFSQGQNCYGSNGDASPKRPPLQMLQLSRKTSLNMYNVSSVMLTRSRPASSKADIFEAKVASAVDEANSSDSEETFVYESNPPEQGDRPRRYHSRTPSATSMASQLDQRNGVRSVLDGSHSVAMKKSMKFANSYSTNTADTTTGEDDGKGTARSNMGTGRGTTHHHHIGRWGRNGANSHPSLFDNESPFPNAAKSKLSGNAPRHSSQPTSPRVTTTFKMTPNPNGKKSPMVQCDMDDTADDEQTPLLASVRSGRSGRNRRPVSTRQLEHQASRHGRSFMSPCAGCLVLFLMILLVIGAILAFMYATTQPLADVKIVALKNVLASEQDVILDMKVEGRNPNVVVVAIDSTDLVIFAKSKYAGTDSEWRKQPLDSDRMRWGLRRRDDDPQDPPLDNDPSTSPNLEIGHVYGLNSPLTFEASPFHQTQSISTGQIRISHPGNHTYPAGSERWGRVLQHEFELIVWGTLQYTLPFTQKYRSILVEERVTVKPNAADSDPDTVQIIS